MFPEIGIRDGHGSSQLPGTCRNSNILGPICCFNNNRDYGLKTGANENCLLTYPGFQKFYIPLNRPRPKRKAQILQRLDYLSQDDAAKAQSPHLTQ
jgi:hypothetical protein